MMRIVLLAACFALTGCLSAQPAVVPSIAADASAGEMLAAEFAIAADAETAGDLPALRRALSAIGELGADPADDASRELLARWHARFPDDPPMRGRTLGPGVRTGTLDPHGKMRLEQTFLAGRKATIALSSRGGAVLQLRVLGDNRAVCDESGVRSACRWVPTFSSRYTIEVENPAQASQRYFLVID